MRLEIKGLAELQARLKALNPAEIMATALAAEAERLAQAVRDDLATPPGAGGHDRPWAQTGAAQGEAIARAIGEAVSSALRGNATPAPSTLPETAAPSSIGNDSTRPSIRRTYPIA